MEKRTMRDYVYLTPSVLRQQLAGQWEEPLAAAFAARPVRILRLVASGSSYNAALCVRPYLRKWLDCEVLVTEPFTFCAYESRLPADELAVVISQSGYSTNALHALDTIRAKGRTAIGITSDLSSDFRTHADLLIDYGCGQESVGYVTMGVTALCLFLCLFALRSAHLSGRLSEDGLAAERQKLAQWADAYEQAIPAGEALLRSRYRQLSAMQTVCIAGAGAAWGVAREAALKLMETLQISACAYELEEFLHGPELHLTPNHTLFFLASDPHDRARGAQLSRAASLVTEKTFFFTDDGGDLPVPSSPDALLTPLLFLPFFQLTAYRLTEDLHRWHKHPLVADFESAVSGKSANYVSKEVL